MIARLLGAGARALLVVLIIVAPAFLLPGASVASQEISLIVAGIAAAFTVFEYASTHPGLIDFRFAPPYNRVRFIAFSVQVLCLVFLARAIEGQDNFSAEVLAFADRAVAALDFPASPVRIARSTIAAGEDPAFELLITRGAAVSFIVTFASMLFFAALLWIFHWPVGRRDFNLWINLPTFEPGYGRDVERRLNRDGMVNVLAGLAFLYLLPVLLSRAGGWFDPSVLSNYQPFVWGLTFWAFGAGSMVIRGAAVLKVAYLVRRTRAI
ncbi:hypothetical protein GE300_12590 [Rhodobacteraceae bacterium 2CG4]|uniref:Uncharacterized protein n=1 Tax=Halovulum marinum TaxID=2662447 RepID=A0A6L5Z2Y7_9RHOB|nr:hypothetical protein [Halovulum marinum]MSU90445.1 hypothetical protein [Halovulum marinum]